MFRNVIRLSKDVSQVVTPYDLEQSLLRPQHDPLCGEIMSRLLHKKSVKKGPGVIDAPTAQILAADHNLQTLDYETWNLMLAKRFSSMFKYFRKFSIRHFNIDPLVQLQTETQEQQNTLPSDPFEAETKNPEAQEKPEESQEAQQNGLKDHTKQTGAESSEQQLVQLQEQLAQTQQEQSQEESKEQAQPVARERVTRSRTAASTQQIGSTAQNKQIVKKVEKPKKEEVESKSQQEILPPAPIEQMWSSDIREHLVGQHHEQNLTVRFQYEDLGGLGGYQQLKVEQLQIIKLFCEDLDSKDPFYIQGQDWNPNQKDDGPNSYFVGFDAIEEFEDTNQFGMGSAIFGQKQEVLFKRFHDINCKQRLDILFFLCQSKLDSEQPEFILELQQLQQNKALKQEDGNINGKSQEDQKQMLEPINFCVLRELGSIKEDVLTSASQEMESLQVGKYFYFPFFSDTRIYIQSFDHQDFKLIHESYEDAQNFIAKLKSFSEREDYSVILDRIQCYEELLKKYSDEMKWKEASKVRKLKSQIRSRMLQEHSRKKLQFEGRQSQIQTDYLHHTQGKVMTRKQIDTLKSKITKTSAQDESKRRDKKNPQFDPASLKIQEVQKEKLEKDRQERQRRLEKRMKRKERIATGQVGKKRRRGEDGEESDQDYDQEDDQDDSVNSKRVKADQDIEQEETKLSKPQEPETYQIVLTGSLQSMFKRDLMNLSIVNENLVLRGSWKLTVEESGEEFIYKKVGPALQEDLLTQLFCENPEDKITLPQLDPLLSPAYREMLGMYFSSSGLYEGYFKYNGQNVEEQFSFILRKTKTKSKKQYTFDLCGYGENQIGCFIMLGTIQLLPFDKLVEKETAKQFRKVKLAKISMQRNYQKKILEEMVEEKLNQRKQQQNKGEIYLEKTKTYFKISNIKDNMGPPFSRPPPQQDYREPMYQQQQQQYQYQQNQMNSNIFAIHRKQNFESNEGQHLQKTPQLSAPTQQMIDLNSNQGLINKLLHQQNNHIQNQLQMNMPMPSVPYGNPFGFGANNQLDPQRAVLQQHQVPQVMMLPTYPNGIGVDRINEQIQQLANLKIMVNKQPQLKETLRGIGLDNFLGINPNGEN